MLTHLPNLHKMTNFRHFNLRRTLEGAFCSEVFLLSKEFTNFLYNLEFFINVIQGEIILLHCGNESQSPFLMTLVSKRRIPVAITIRHLRKMHHVDTLVTPPPYRQNSSGTEDANSQRQLIQPEEEIRRACWILTWRVKFLLIGPIERGKNIVRITISILVTSPCYPPVYFIPPVTESGLIAGEIASKSLLP